MIEPAMLAGRNANELWVMLLEKAWATCSLLKHHDLKGIATASEQEAFGVRVRSWEFSTSKAFPLEHEEVLRK